MPMKNPPHPECRLAYDIAYTRNREEQYQGAARFVAGCYASKSTG